MEIIRAILIAVEAICSLLLIVIILIQKTKSEGLGLAFGAGVGETLFGSRAGNVLTRITVVLGIVFLANTLVLAIIYSGVSERSLMEQVTGPRGQPAPPPSRPAPAPQTSADAVAPTLPGATFDDSAMPPATAPATVPGEQPAIPLPEDVAAEGEPAP
jgi:preprotein translocase subunit SecG